MRKEALATMESFKSQQWKMKDKDGKLKPVSGLIGDIIARINLYIPIGDTMIQQNPVGVALVWGGFKLLLQVAPCISPNSVSVQY
jgi:hypothetical protein